MSIFHIVNFYIHYWLKCALYFYFFLFFPSFLFWDSEKSSLWIMLGQSLFFKKKYIKIFYFTCPLAICFVFLFFCTAMCV